MTTTITPNTACPSGVTFYACADESHFVGCCVTDPCSPAGCAQGNLVPAAFEASQYGQLPDQECSAGSFYTCQTTSPAFWGCCRSNPCNSDDGCAQEDLAGAYLSGNPQQAEPFLEAFNASFAGASATVASSTSHFSTRTKVGTISTFTTSGAADQTIEASPSMSVAPATRSNNVGAIAGGVVGGVVVLAALVYGISILLRRRRRTQESSRSHGDLPRIQEFFKREESSGRKEDSDHSNFSSPSVPPYPGSPPKPQSQFASPQVGQVRFELTGSTPVQHEMDSGQSYHPYRRGPK